jgi:high-affinity nickel permease
VFSLAAALAPAAQTVNTGIPALQSSGGLGFDTETEVGMLGLAAGVATHEVPFPA